MKRREVGRLVSVTVLAAVSGCLAEDDQHRPQDEPRYDDVVEVRNQMDESIEIHVRIVHVGGEGTVHDETHRLESESTKQVYDFRDAPTDGVERYAIWGEVETGEEELFIFHTNESMIEPWLSIDVNGDLSSSWAEVP